jgi:archaellum component FlaF (FlaF/FlaG flagellin family)
MPGGAGRGVAVGAVVLFESRLVLLSAVYSDRPWCCRKVDDGAKLRVNNRHRAVDLQAAVVLTVFCPVCPVTSA